MAIVRNRGPKYAVLIQPLADGRSYLVIEDPTWTTCNISDKKSPVLRPCKTIEAGAATLPAPSNPQH